MMWTIEEAVERGAALGQKLTQALFDAMQCIFGEVTECDARLVRDDGNAIPCHRKSTQCARRAVRKTYACGIDIHRHVLDQRAVFVEQYGARRHARASMTVGTTREEVLGCER